MTIAEPVNLARELLLGEDVIQDRERAPRTIATAQAWATLAVAEAIGRLAAAAEDLHDQG
jgi:hypothetical protein